MVTDLEATPSWGKRLLGIEGLRGIAASTVLIGHVQSHLHPGLSLGRPLNVVLGLVLNGLTLFFALSGFLLYRPFAAAIVRGERLPGAARFFKNRALRIYPAYAIILLLVCLVLGVAYTRAADIATGEQGTADTVGYLTDPFKLLANLTMLHTLWPSTIKTGLGVSWSLTVELVFYLVLPALAWAAFRAARGRAWCASAAIAAVPAFALLFLGVLGSLFSAAIAPHGGTPPAAFYYRWGDNWYAVLARSFPVEADLFAFGMLAAVLLVLVEQGRIAGRGVVVLQSLAASGVLIGVGLGHFGGHLPMLADTWWALAFGGLILLVTLPTKTMHHNLLAKCLDIFPLRYLGLISYSMYLWHLPVLWMLDKHNLTFANTKAGFVGNVVLVFGVTVALATVTYFGIEKQAERFKVRTDGREGSRKLTRAAAASA